MVVFLKQEDSQESVPDRLGVYRSETNHQLRKMRCSEMYLWGGQEKAKLTRKEDWSDSCF